MSRQSIKGLLLYISARVHLQHLKAKRIQKADCLLFLRFRVIARSQNYIYLLELIRIYV